jgi:hypothetical protein
VVILLYFDDVALDDTNDGAGEFGCTVIGIHAYFEVRPCGSGETDEQQHKGDRESTRGKEIVTHRTSPPVPAPLVSRHAEGELLCAV